MKCVLNIVCVLLLLLKTSAAIAQDIILDVDGNSISGKVTEITLSAVVYEVSDSGAVQQLTIPKKQVFLIKYANGTKEVFPESLNGEAVQEKLRSSPLQELTPGQLYLLGVRDAKVNYNGSNILLTNFLITLFMPPAGIISGVATAMSPPKDHNLHVPNPGFLQEKHYMEGYRKQAHRRKAGKAVAGVGIGLAPYVILFALALAAVSGAM